MKKAISILLLAAMLTSTFASCSEAPVEESETKPAADTAAADPTAPETEEKVDVMAHLEKKDWGGADFTVVGKNEGYGEWEMFELNAEEVTGEPINDAVWERNLYLTENYNIIPVGYKAGGPTTVFRNAVQANTGDFEGALIPVNEAVSLAVEGLLYDFRNLPIVNLEADYYDQNSNKSLSVANRLYFSFGDMTMQNLDLTWCVMFNKQLVDQYQIGSIYDLVSNNEWTIAKLLELSNNITNDTDGNGVLNEYDLYGNATPYDRTTMAFMYSGGVEFVTKDENDYPVYNPLSELAYNVFSDALAYFSTDSCLNINTLPGAWRKSEEMFMNNQFLFYTECMQNLARFRDMEVDFGVVPMPKYTPEQENYVSMVCDFPATLVIPSYCTDLDFTGFTVEALNAKSSETVRTAYVDKCLKYKYSRDEESSAYLNIILDTMYYDPAYIYRWGGLSDTIGLLVSKGYDMLASQSKSIEKKIKADIEECVTAYKEHQ